MDDPIRSLPSLRALLVFHAVGHHLNMTRAATDLSVTHEAVSNQIRQLEDHIGKKLFIRHHRNLELTEAGRHLYDGVAKGFRLIGSSLRDARDQDAQPAVTLTTTVTFAGSVLLARLKEFQSEHPTIDIRIIENDRPLDLEREGIDMAVRYGSGGWNGVSTTHLFDEDAFPVCSPAMANKHPELSDMANIPNFRLLHLDGAAHQREDWPHLLEAASVEYSGRLGGLWSLDYGNILSAARNGQGIAIGWGHAVDKYLRNGELVNPTGKVFKTGRGYYLLRCKSRPLSLSAQIVHDWMVETFRQK